MPVKKRPERLVHIADYQQTFSSPHGKKVLKGLIKNFYMKRSYVPGDPQGTAFNDGQAEVVRHIIHQMKFDLKAIEKLLLEKEEVYSDN